MYSTTPAEWAKIIIAQPAGAVEYTDYFSAEG